MAFPHLLSDPAAWAALLTLIAMEVVLGIDNLIFISILTNKLPTEQQSKARRLGIGMALILRLALLGLVSIIVQLTTPVITLWGQGFSWRDLILLAGGLFLIWKATKEIHHHVDPDPGEDLFAGKAVTRGFATVIAQIVLLDIVFSVDSIITAVGMTNDVPIMVTAVDRDGGGDDGGSEPAGELHQRASHHRDAGTGLPADDRHGARCGRLRRACAEGLSVRSDGVLGTHRGSEHAVTSGAEEAGSGAEVALARAIACAA